MIKPLYNRVIIQPDESKKETSAGIILPPNAQEKPVQGTIVAHGPGKHVGELFIPISVKVGDRVLYGKHAGDKITLEGVDYVAMLEIDLIGVL